ncbi:phosphoenolpyruvate--protein phosphotransferase [Marinivivus vitaminiproducens]|uniref:phosphoenolpyruvate--protein phosphotransferase n=1 Tax=Marinivivus vitaminiproducens TaxID=3035935 RepID=UPI00279949C4|nr:phosphoenolpyruvate--protein phosphotransferase [Geminicoccaceae bacterium SCSIO 64248]
MGETVLTGRGASSGLAIGSAVLARRGESGCTTGEAKADALHLREAIDRARAEIENLAADLDDDAGEILAFQIELLDDGSFMDPAFVDIGQGATCKAALDRAFAAQVALFESDDDPYFQARAADVRDVHERLVRLLSGQSEPGSELPAHAVWVAEDLTPSLFLTLERKGLAAVVLARGSAASHVAMLARAREVPMVVGVGGAGRVIGDGAELVVDADAGEVVVDADQARLEACRRRLIEQRDAAALARAWRGRTPVTSSGRRIAVEINVEDPLLLDRLDPADCDGIGLVRTEFLYDDAGAVDEDRQFAIYRRLLGWAKGRPVTVRTLDAGGDKPIAGLTGEPEPNPFLGLRGIRLSLARPEVFAVQLRALARAAAHGPLRVMVPMVSVPEEIDEVRALLGRMVTDLLAEGRAAAMPPLGMMVEVPSAALCARDFAVDFYSIGSNDLAQYVLAAARDQPDVAHLYRPMHPSVLRLIREVVEAGRDKGVLVSLCGDLAGEPAAVSALLELGLERLSVTPAALGRVKHAIADLP